MSDSRRQFIRSAVAFAAASSCLADERPVFSPLAEVTVGGVRISTSTPPSFLRNDANLGILLHKSCSVQRIHARPKPEDWCGESRAIKTPSGDYLLMFTAGLAHYGEQQKKVNSMIAYRSSDSGRTWTGPTVPWVTSYNQHGFVPLIPSGSHKIYAFGTEPIFNRIEDRENAPIGFRTSEDDGRTWFPVTLISPKNDPTYIGMFVMRMCETDRGTWLMGPHCGVLRQPRQTTLYVLRSTDHGSSWALLPAARPNGWTEPKYRRMEEGRPISLGNGRVLLMVRTAEGHLWRLRSSDEGRTWTEPAPTPLVHPLAPPMVCHLSDGKTLAVLHHNRAAGNETSSPNAEDRSELWISLSRDDGESWIEPRFLLANSAARGGRGSFADYSVSYADLFTDSGFLHIFISHQFRQVLYVRLPENAISELPVKSELSRHVRS
jgi:BNR repeat-like domain